MNYEKIYNDIISKAKAEDRKKIKGGIYYEAHHIIPKCMGGDGKVSDRRHPNIILLTAKEHYIAHRLLALIYPNNQQLQYAIWMMITGAGKYNRRYAPSSRVYTRLREDFIITVKTKIFSEDTRKKMSSAAKGKLKGPMSDETKKKLSDIAKARPLRGPMSDDHKKKILESRKEYTPSNETKKKISDALKDRVFSADTIKKMSDSKIGKIFSESHKKKMSESANLRIRKKFPGGYKKKKSNLID